MRTLAREIWEARHAPLAPLRTVAHDSKAVIVGKCERSKSHPLPNIWNMLGDVNRLVQGTFFSWNVVPPAAKRFPTFESLSSRNFLLTRPREFSALKSLKKSPPGAFFWHAKSISLQAASTLNSATFPHNLTLLNSYLSPQIRGFNQSHFQGATTEIAKGKQMQHSWNQWQAIQST